MHPLLKILESELRIDARQMVDEGHDLAALNKEIDAAAATGSIDVLAKLQEELWNRPSPAGYRYEEPNDWAAISRSFPDAESAARLSGGEAALQDKLLGAWQGRCAGCQLGKPFEGEWPEGVENMCVESGSWPLTDYLKQIDDATRLEQLNEIQGWGKRLTNWRWLMRGRFDSVAPDDDIHYAIAGLITLEEHGIDFTTEQAIATIYHVTPHGVMWSAGLNMARKYAIGVPVPLTAVFGNNSRQSLGSMIRCDPFGWAAPANPALAAQLAWRDAIGSQTRNGIYSGMFFAAAMADAIAHGDPVRALATAEKYVPARSRFAEMIAFTRQACGEHRDWEDANKAIYARYDHDLFAPERAPMNHGLINAAIVILAILKGEGDFSKTIGISVMAGRDTDCNGATAGSIMGCALGAKKLPPHWITPLNDTVRTDLLGMPTLKISELARRTFEVAKGNCRHAG